MIPRIRNPAAVALAIFVLLTVMLILGTVFVVDSATVRHTRFSWTVQDDHTVLVSLQHAFPGDVVTFRYDHHAGHPVSHYDFLVTEPGDAQQIREGEPPREAYVYYRDEGITSQDCCHRDPLMLTRPGAPSGEPINEIALVWIYWHADDVPVPVTEEDRNMTRDQVIQSRFGTETAETIPSAAVRLSRWMVGLTLLSGAGALVAGGIWIRQSGAPVVPPLKGQETEALVSLVQAGYDHLRMLRAAILVVLIVVLIAGLILINVFFLHLADYVPSPLPNWRLIVQGTSLALWIVITAVCVNLLVKTQRTLRRWKQHMDRDPLAD